MTIELISGSVNALLEIISSLGYLGILIGMAIESSFFPFPSEVILIPAGALVAQGKMSFTLVFIMAILGSLIGALINFAIAFFLGRKAIDALTKKYGKFLFISKKSVKKSDIYFS
ncbi:MAG: DedA family protein, partial [Nanoarchaeota archaeon]|nr:DedA family protein [Nanoarchaeota archaeon]